MKPAPHAPPELEAAPSPYSATGEGGRHCNGRGSRERLGEGGAPQQQQQQQQPARSRSRKLSAEEQAEALAQQQQQQQRASGSGIGHARQGSRDVLHKPSREALCKTSREALHKTSRDQPGRHRSRDLESPVGVNALVSSTPGTPTPTSLGSHPPPRPPSTNQSGVVAAGGEGAALRPTTDALAQFEVGQGLGQGLWDDVGGSAGLVLDRGGGITPCIAAFEACFSE